MFTKVRQFAVGHKFVSGLIAVAILVGGWYWYSSASVAPAISKYVIQKATAETVVASVSGTGQVAAGTSVQVKPQTSENVTHVYVNVGQHVVQGQILLQLDTTVEAKAVAQAKISLQSSQISLAKLREAPATTTLEGAQDAVTQAVQAIATASSSLSQDYQTGFDSLSSAFIDFQNAMVALQNFSTGADVSKFQSDPDAYVNILPNYLQASGLPYRDAVQSNYTAAVAAYQQNFKDYHSVNRNSSSDVIDSLLVETQNTGKAIGNALKAVKDLLNYVVNSYPQSSSTSPLPGVTNTFQTNFATYLTTNNGDVSNLGNTITTLAADKNTITNDATSLKSKQDALATLQSGADPLDLQSQNLSIQQAQLNLQTAEQNLAYDSIRAPISGTVSAVPAVIGTTAPSPAVTIVSDQNVAQVTLNEVDAAKVSVGDAATLSFSALPNVSIAGHVVQMDAVGTVSQGVVNYMAEISIETAARATTTLQIKPGMSVSANIVTQVHQDVVAVPSAAVKTSAGASYVLEPATTMTDAEIIASQSGGVSLPNGTKMVPVTLGIVSSGVTEITSGVVVGDQIVAQTISSAAKTTSASTANTSALRLLGGGATGGLGGGGVRTGGAGAATGR